MAPLNPGSLSHYDPVHAVLPDAKLTPGEVFPNATKDDLARRDGPASIGT
jgi:hypothetical protein